MDTSLIHDMTDGSGPQNRGCFRAKAPSQGSGDQTGKIWKEKSSLTNLKV
jgi:hypothetical protein